MATHVLRPTTYVRDVVISKSRFLPGRLLIDLEDEKSGFLISFLIHSSEDILKELLVKSDNMDDKDFELWFFEKKSPKELPKEISSSRLYDFVNNSYKTEINSSTVPYQKYSDNPPIYHIDVIFHTYEETE